MAVVSLLTTVCMTLKTHRKPRQFSARWSAFLACSILGVVPASRLEAQVPPTAPAAPSTYVPLATLNRLFSEAEAGFAAKDYPTAIAKIQELLKALGSNKDAPQELLYC